jgi:hypothetical protein
MTIETLGHHLDDCSRQHADFHSVEIEIENMASICALMKSAGTS